MEFPYGAVYFRKTNPPRQDWARDYRTAAEDGMTHFRHWFMWAGVEYQRGVFDWQDYDEQMDLAAEHGLKTIIAEHIMVAPEWAFLELPDARLESADGRRQDSRMQVSATIGGSPGLCLDHPAAREHAGRFLTELVTRYRDHPAMAGYDVWNECNVPESFCHCPATAAEFRTWLKARYATLAHLRQAWGRYYGDWSEIQTPREPGPYGDSLDWLAYRTHRAHEHLRWRVDLIRALDDRHPITAHGVAGTLGFGVSKSTDDWLASAEVDSYGFTFVASRRGDPAWKQPLAVEVVRSASRGKRFWHAEAQGGPLWLQPQVLGRPLDDGRVTTPQDIRFWNLVSFAGGARGLFFPRWRPLLDGPLFGAFGPYGMNGGRTPRSEQAARLAHWATDPANHDLWEATPVTDGITLLYLPQSQAWGYLLRGSHKPYEHAISGAWRALFDAGFHANIARLEDLPTSDVVYLPYPLLLPARAGHALREWVAAGGTLISEGAPSWFDDTGRAYPLQPGGGLQEVFGATEADILFTPDALEDLTFRAGNAVAHGGEVRQTFTPTTGSATGWYDDGSVAAVDHEFGAGRTRLIGTMPGTGYSTHSGRGTLQFFRESMAWAGVQPRVRVSAPTVFARLHRSKTNAFLWLLNPSTQDVQTDVALNGPEQLPDSPQVRWGAKDSTIRLTAKTARVLVKARDAVVLHLLAGPISRSHPDTEA